MALQPFLTPSFDATDYLNSTLPPLSTATIRQDPASVPLSELSSQTQTLLSQLSAQTARVSESLTQLTDEILRSGSRLAYEVEVLRGDTIGFAELLNDGLTEDIKVFVPQGLLSPKKSNVKSTGLHEDESHSALKGHDQIEEATARTPGYMVELKMLSKVRNELENVIKTFGNAMEWPIPPSEVSVASSFISVSAPDPGSESHSREEKGRQVAKELREQINALFESDSDPEIGVQAAASRVNELRELSKVWKGTAEEKARTKFVDGLARTVEEKHRAIERERAQQPSSRVEGSVTSTLPRKGSIRKSTEAQDPVDQGRLGWPAKDGGYGFINHLQKIRGGL
jgi:hypothetical protein